MMIEIPTWVNAELKPVEKLAAHQLGLKHKAVSVFILRDDEVLLQRRAMVKYHTPGLWANACCTHPHWDEPTYICAARRLDEELGITGQSLEFRQTVEYRADVGHGLIEHEVVDIFVAQASPNMAIAPNPKEVMDVAWVKFDQLQDLTQTQPDRYTPWLQIYLAKHAEEIFGDALTV